MTVKGAVKKTKMLACSRAGGGVEAGLLLNRRTAVGRGAAEGPRGPGERRRSPLTSIGAETGRDAAVKPSEPESETR